jgi:hypothetical protein
MLAVILFVILVGGGVALGWWRGGARLGLSLAPLLVCSVFLWLGGGIAYQVDMMRNLGLIWPALFLIIPGLIAGYALRYWLKKKLPVEPGQTDRIIGGAVGLLIGLVLTWLGLVYQTVWYAAHEQQSSGFNQGVARVLNNGVVRWIPGVGAGSNMVMDMMDIATAPREAQEKAVKELGLDKLRDVPELQAIADDPDLQAEIESIQRGNIAALWRLQKDERILALMEQKDFRDALERLSLDDIAEAVKRAEQEDQRSGTLDPANDDDG